MKRLWVLSSNNFALLDEGIRPLSDKYARLVTFTDATNDREDQRPMCCTDRPVSRYVELTSVQDLDLPEDGEVIVECVCLECFAKAITGEMAPLDMCM